MIKIKDGEIKLEKILIFDFPDNSSWVKEFQQQHPILYKFIRKYGNQTETKYAQLQRKT
jgi:hypothetical protein